MNTQIDRVSVLRSVSAYFDDATMKKIEAATPEEGARLITSSIDLEGMSETDVAKALGRKPSVKAVNLKIGVEATEGEQVAVDVVNGSGEPVEAKMDDLEEEPEAAPTKSGGFSVNRAAMAKASAIYGAAGQAASSPRSELGRRIKSYDDRARTTGKIVLASEGVVDPMFSSGERAALFGLAFKSMMIREHGSRLDEYGVKITDDEAALIKMTKAHGTSPNSLGGALVPEDFSSDVLYFPNEYGAFKRACGVTTMRRETLIVPRVRGAFAVSKVSQNGAMTSQDKPDFDNVTLRAEKQGGILRVSVELLNDSPVNIGELIARDVERAHDKFDDDTALTGANGGPGMGAAQFTADGTDHYDAGAAGVGSWTSLGVTHVEQVLSLIPSAAWTAGNVGIVCHRSFFAGVLARFGASAAAVSDSGAGLFNATVPLPTGDTSTYRALPVWFSDSMPSSYSADQISMLAGSFRGGCKCGEVEGSGELVTSDQRYFEFDQIGFKSTKRVARNIHNVGGSDTEGDQTLVVALKD